MRTEAAKLIESHITDEVLRLVDSKAIRATSAKKVAWAMYSVVIDSLASIPGEIATVEFYLDDEDANLPSEDEYELSVDAEALVNELSCDRLQTPDFIQRKACMRVA